MSETVSVPGGLLATVSLDPSELVAVQTAMNAAGASFGGNSAVHSRMSQAPEAGAFNVYDIFPGKGQKVFQKAGEQVIVLTGLNGAVLTGLANATGNLLIGNAGNDTVNVSGGSGTVFLGDGKNQFNMTGGVETVVTGKSTSQDTFVLQNGNLTIQGSAHKTVSVTGSADTVSTTGSANIHMSTGTLVLHAGNDTVTATGSATVTGGTGNLHFNGSTNSTVRAGSGHETLIGGTGATTFFGSKSTSGVDSMVGGAGTNRLVGGKGHDTLVSGASKGATSDVFEFDNTVSGGTHTIVGYHSATDQIQLHGYTSGNVSSIGPSGSDTLITLNDGTHITVKNANVTLAQLHFT